MYQSSTIKRLGGPMGWSLESRRPASTMSRMGAGGWVGLLMAEMPRCHFSYRTDRFFPQRPGKIEQPRYAALLNPEGTPMATTLAGQVKAVAEFDEAVQKLVKKVKRT